MPLTLKKNVQGLIAYLPLAFTFLLPISQKLSTICLGLWFIVALATIKKEALCWNVAFLIPIIYYVAIAISLFFSDTFDGHFLEHKLSFLALPIIFFLKGAKIFKDKVRLLHFFVYGCISAIGVCLLLAFLRSMGQQDGILVFRPKLIEGFSTYHSIIYGGNHFFGNHFSVLHQTVYFAMYLTFALIILIEFPFKNKLQTRSSIIFLLISIGMTMNRASYIALFLIAVYYLFFLVKTKLGRVALFCAIILSGIILYKSDPRLARMKTNVERYFNPDGTVDEITSLNNIDRRPLLWYTAVQIIRENPVFGVGIADVNKELNKYYRKFETGTLQDLNAHNQYLQMLLELGITGLFLLALMMVLVWQKGIAYNPPSFVLSFLLLLLINFLFESMFNRYSGLSFYCFFYCLITMAPGKKFSESRTGTSILK
ncbi:O-antigen ligase family protein [Flagellimonas beolgyonensis]|uniref:O-antigen ligase family protein n=1 Tax=Flagellimonas beolgyonensis TaxID=864064 RepID=UPI000F8F4A44|nr:O-antigen ligase family protein [Allomuricauda beolgyonensis]